MNYYHEDQNKTISQLKKSFSNVSFPGGIPEDAWLADNSILKVEEWPTIDHDTQKIERISGSVVDNKWRNFVVREKSNNEKWDELRDKRNSLLTNSDFTQLDDCPKDKSKWKSYRKALRDLPENYPNADDVIWPTEPDS